MPSMKNALARETKRARASTIWFARGLTGTDSHTQCGPVLIHTHPRFWPGPVQAKRLVNCQFHRELATRPHEVPRQLFAPFRAPNARGDPLTHLGDRRTEKHWEKDIVPPCFRALPHRPFRHRDVDPLCNSGIHRALVSLNRNSGRVTAARRSARDRCGMHRGHGEGHGDAHHRPSKGAC